MASPAMQHGQHQDTPLLVAVSAEYSEHVVATTKRPTNDRVNTPPPSPSPPSAPGLLPSPIPRSAFDSYSSEKYFLIGGRSAAADEETGIRMQGAARDRHPDASTLRRHRQLVILCILLALLFGSYILASQEMVESGLHSSTLGLGTPSAKMSLLESAPAIDAMTAGPVDEDEGDEDRTHDDEGSDSTNELEGSESTNDGAELGTADEESEPVGDNTGGADSEHDGQEVVEARKRHLRARRREGKRMII